MSKNKIGLFFGSFNPVHNGHLMLANYIVEFTDLDSIWFVVSPQNPFKTQQSMLDEKHRLEMLELAVRNEPRFEVCDIEFHMPKPSYTIDTLMQLSKLHPDTDFYLICGMDNLTNFHKWKNYQAILDNYHILVYPRKGYAGGELLNHKSVQLIEAPEIEVSSTFIRDAIAKGKDIRYFMPNESYKYMIDMKFYND